MADPTGANMSALDAERVNYASPINLEMKVGDRVRQLRTDLEDVGTFDGTELTLNPDNGTSGKVIVPGDLEVQGATSTISSTNTVIEDQLIELGNGRTGSASGDAGIVIERGDDTNVGLFWDESADSFVLGSGAITGASTGDLTISNEPLAVSQLNASSGIEVTSHVTATSQTAGGGSAVTSGPAVTMNGRKGVITVDLATAGDNIANTSGFTVQVNNTSVATDSVVNVCSSAGDLGPVVHSLGSGVFKITGQNQSGSSITTNFTFNFIVL